MLLYLFCNKSHYENVPFEIPENWCWTTLGEVGKWQSGATPSRLCKEYYGGDIPWLKTGDLNDGYITDIPEYITQKALKETSVKLNPAGSVLIAMYGATIGKVGILTFPATTNQACCACVEYEATDQQYLFYFLLSHKENFIHQGGGGAQPNISKEKIVETLLPLPPFNEQKRIVNEVEKWFSIIDKIESGTIELESHVKQIKSKILDLAISGKLVPQDPNDEPAIELLKRINPDFQPCDNSHYENLPKNWCLAKVKDVFVINPRNKAEDNTIAGFIPMTLIDDGYSNTFSYEKQEWGSIKTGFTHFADGDVAVAKISPCLENRKSIVLRDLPNGIGAGTTELHVFRSSVVIPEYALYFFKSEYFISKCVGTFNGVVGQQRVGKNIIEETQIPIPPINEQTRIVSTIETIFTQLNTITAEL